MDKIALIIDGHPVYGKKMESFFESQEFESVTRVKTKDEALKVLQTQQFSLILLSGMLEGEETVALCHQVKKLNASAGIIVQVGLAVPDETKVAFKKAGASFVIDRKEKDLSPLQKAIDDLRSGIEWLH